MILLTRFPSEGVVDGRFSFAVLGEIEERRQFLADMVSLGQGQKYRNIINTEISQVKPLRFRLASSTALRKTHFFRAVMSQKVHELEMLDRRSSFQGATTSEGRRPTKEPTRSTGETDGSR